MWIIGGRSNTNLKSDVWYSADGINWTEATSSAQWSSRSEHASTVYDGKMWVFGGYDSGMKNDVWYSTDGASWTNATNSAPWSPRSGHTSAVYDGKMWIIGGSNKSSSFNDVWYSTDGVNWIEVNTSAPWVERTDHSSVVLDGKLWVIGGRDFDTTAYSDVWCSDNLTGIEEVSDSEITSTLSASASPNPFSLSPVIISAEGFSGICEITIFDLRGNLVVHDSIIDAYIWSDSSTPSGIYFAVINDSSGGRASVRMVKI